MYAANPNRPLKKCDSDIPIAPAAEVWNAMMKKMPTAIRMMDTISSLTLLSILRSSASAAFFLPAADVFEDDELLLLFVPPDVDLFCCRFFSVILLPL